MEATEIYLKHEADWLDAHAAYVSVAEVYIERLIYSAFGDPQN